MTESKMSEILNRLLFEKNIRPTELARITNVPQPTIQRIVAGTTSRPHIGSLEPIANFFGITVDQLRGLKSIPWLDQEEHTQQSLKSIPILNWNGVIAWLNTHEDEKNKQLTDNIITDANISNKAYALNIKDASMEPLFSIGTTVIIDPEKEIKDRRFVIIQLDSHPEVILRQLIIDLNDQYIKPLSPDLNQFKMHKLGKNDKICGILVQAKRNFDE